MFARLSPSQGDTRDSLVQCIPQMAFLSDDDLAGMAEAAMPTDQPSFGRYLALVAPKYLAQMASAHSHVPPMAHAMQRQTGSHPHLVTGAQGDTPRAGGSYMSNLVAFMFGQQQQQQEVEWINPPPNHIDQKADHDASFA